MASMYFFFLIYTSTVSYYTSTITHHKILTIKTCAITRKQKTKNQTLDPKGKKHRTKKLR